MLSRFLLRSLARLRTRAGLLVLTYHRVLPAPDPMLPGEPDVDRFAAQMAFLREHLEPVGLVEGVERLFSGDLPPGAVAVTFDDGYANNLTCALPVLLRYRIPATVFVATDLLDGGLMFNDMLLQIARDAPGPALDLHGIGGGRLPLGPLAQRRAAFARLIEAVRYRPPAERQPFAERLAAEHGVELRRDLMLTTSQLRALASEGVEIGGHTRTHPILALLPPSAARAEIAGSADRLEAILGVRPRAFAYPNGTPGRDFMPEHCAMVREAGYTLACSTTRGCVLPTDDRFALPRATLWSSTPARLLRNLGSIYLHAGARAA